MNYILYLGDELYSNTVSLFTKNKLQISNGYTRVVTGDRGPYVEFSDSNLILKSFFITKDCLYRITDRRVYYVEFRSNDESNTKLYYQLQTVAYADYKIGMFYISPYDLYFDDGRCIIKRKDERIISNIFF